MRDEQRKYLSQAGGDGGAWARCDAIICVALSHLSHSTSAWVVASGGGGGGGTLIVSSTTVLASNTCLPASDKTLFNNKKPN